MYIYAFLKESTTCIELYIYPLYNLGTMDKKIMISFRVDEKEKAMIEALSERIARSQSDTIRFAVECLNSIAESISRKDALALGRE